MFASLVQNGQNGIEIFSPSGTDPLKFIKLSNEAQINKIYDREMKGYLLTLEKENPTTSVQSKSTLGIYQPLVIFQIQLSQEKGFSLELKISDSAGQRRRLLLSTNCRDLECNGLHCRIPWSQTHRIGWNNVVVNLHYLVAAVFKGAQFASLDSFDIRPCCKLRKVFSLPLLQLTDWAEGIVSIPPQFDFPTSTFHYNYVIKLSQHEAKGERKESRIDGLVGSAIVAGPLVAAEAKKSEKHERNTAKSVKTQNNLQQQPQPQFRDSNTRDVLPGKNSARSTDESNVQTTSTPSLNEMPPQVVSHPVINHVIKNDPSPLQEQKPPAAKTELMWTQEEEDMVHAAQSHLATVKQELASLEQMFVSHYGEETFEYEIGQQS